MIVDVSTDKHFYGLYMALPSARLERRLLEHPADLQKGLEPVKLLVENVKAGSLVERNLSFLALHAGDNPAFARQQALRTSQRIDNLMPELDKRLIELREDSRLADIKHALYVEFSGISERQKTIVGGFKKFIERKIREGAAPDDHRLLEDTGRTPFENSDCGPWGRIEYSSRTNYAGQAKMARNEVAQYEEYREHLRRARETASTLLEMKGLNPGKGFEL